jgi:hypothetical protein
MRIIYLIAFLLLTACHRGEQQIASQSIDVSALAHSSKGRFEIIYLEAGKPQSDTKMIRSEALSGAAEQGKIITAINSIIMALPEVQDIASPWLAILKYLLFILCAVGIIVLLFQTGLGAWIKSLFMYFRKRPNA